MKKIKNTLLFLLTVAVILLVMFMIFGSIILFMHFGATKEALNFLMVSCIISIPGIIYLTKQFKKLMGTNIN